VAQGLQETLGAPVEIDSARVGLAGQTTLEGLTVAEAGHPEYPFLEVQHAVADLSALGYAAGRRAPRRVELRGARLRLRFDSAGKLLTHLPDAKHTGAWPHLTVRQGTLTVEQLGRPPFDLEGVEAELTPTVEGAELEGTIHDP